MRKKKTAPPPRRHQQASSPQETGLITHGKNAAPSAAGKPPLANRSHRTIPPLSQASRHKKTVSSMTAFATGINTRCGTRRRRCFQRRTSSSGLGAVDMCHRRLRCNDRS
jgi:hypothetical protein